MASNVMKTFIAPVVCAFVLAGCSNMSDTQQRALSGTAIGAGGGAILAPLAAMRHLAPWQAQARASSEA